MTAPRKRMPAAARREQLLDECARVVDVEGFHAVTIERIATACGVSRTVVHQQFGDLDGMLDALVERSSARAAQTLAAATEAANTDRTSRASMATVLAAVDADPATWRMLLVSPQVGPPALADNIERGRAMLRDQHMETFASLPGSDLDDPELTARLVQAMADELVRLRLADPTVYTTERILDQIDRLGRSFLHQDRSIR